MFSVSFSIKKKDTMGLDTPNGEGRMCMSNELQVDGFLFGSLDDARLAQKEKKQVEYLKTHVDISSPQNMLKLYQKANRERIFRTPIGLNYMQELRNNILAAGMPEDKLEPIPLYVAFEQRLRAQTSPAKRKIKESQKDEQKKRLRISLMLNVLLAVAIIAMFFITLFSKNPNILNYERTLQNQYSAWEQELDEREQAIREKELNMK